MSLFIEDLWDERYFFTCLISRTSVKCEYREFVKIKLDAIQGRCTEIKSQELWGGIDSWIPRRGSYFSFHPSRVVAFILQGFEDVNRAASLVTAPLLPIVAVWFYWQVYGRSIGSLS